MIYFYISLSTYICYNIIKYKNNLATLKESKYDTKKYLKTFNLKTFLNPELLSIIVIILAFITNLKVIGVATIIVYTILFLLNYKHTKKLKLERKSITRLVIILLIYTILNVWFILDYISYHYADIIFDNTAIYYVILVPMSYFSPLITLITNIISKPLDKIRSKHA